MPPAGKTLEQEWKEQLGRMRSNIGNQVMAMAEKNAIFSGKPLTSMVVLLQNCLADKHAPMPGALRYKVEHFEHMLEVASNHGEHLKDVTFTKIRASNLFRHALKMKHYNSNDTLGPMPDTRKVVISLGIEGGYEGSTLNGSHLVNPQWTSQQVLFKLADDTKLPRPLPVTFKVVDQHGEVLGSAVAELSEAFGQCNITLGAQDHSEYTASVNQAPMTLSFLYRVGQWTDGPVIPPELEAGASTGDYSHLLESMSMEAMAAVSAPAPAP